MSIRTRYVSLIAALGVAAATVSSCHDGFLSDETGRATHLDGQGLLSVSAGSGGKALTVPPNARATWRGSFGGMLLCLTDPEAGPLTVTEISYEMNVSGPAAPVSWVRRVPRGTEQHPGPSLHWAPFYGLLGAPGRFGNETVGGDFSRFTSGLAVTQPCDQPPDQGFTELVTELLADRQGTWVKALAIDYTAGDGSRRRLEVPWQMVACGRVTREVCAQGP